MKRGGRSDNIKSGYLEVTMNTITITLPDDRLVQLKEKASRLGVAPEELARAGIEDMLTFPDEIFRHVLENLLHKNKELYQRLAAL
jgi:hypothetical protein